MNTASVTSDAYRRTIYIDFESLKKPPIPALLGILIDDDGDTHFEQVIVDARLESARLASRHLRADSLAATAARLVALNVPLVGWSLYDREVVLADAAVSVDVKEQWKRWYVNGLTIARSWRARVHPTFAISRAARFDPRHTLDQYARLAGYPRARALEHAEPAKWIRHAAGQIAARGHYRHATKQAKRDWHDLLGYNRHDCEALRHVFTRAVAELETWRRHQNTTYCVREGSSRPICFRTGSGSARLDRLLDDHGATRWAFLTAWDPESQRLPHDENVARQKALLERLTSAGIQCLAGEGRAADRTCRAQESILALDIQPHVARAIGHDFGQLAIVVGRRGRPARLVACSG